MGLTITEKILARAAGKVHVAPGDFISVETPCRTVVAPHSARDKALGLLLEHGWAVKNPASVMIVDGHLGASASHRAAEDRAFMWEWANKVGVPEANIVRLGRGGVENMVAAERCWALPGSVYLQGVNGHISTAGALGAFASALSFETAAYLVRGRTWLKVPPTIRVVVDGVPPRGVLPRDVSETLLRRLGPTGAIGCVLEWSGEYISSLSMDGRFAICSQALFSGAWTSIMNPDDSTIRYVHERAAGETGWEPLVSDGDASYLRTVHIDVSELVPVVVVPPTRGSIVDAASVGGVKINKGFIGSDAGGWLEDLSVAAEVLYGNRLPNHVVLNITPGTVEILKQAVRLRLLEIFLDAGCVVPTPNEGMEWGGNTPLERGDVCIATGQTNYPGRMGSTEAEIYLANAAVVSASCLAGEIALPHPAEREPNALAPERTHA